MYPIPVLGDRGPERLLHECVGRFEGGQVQGQRLSAQHRVVAAPAVAQVVDGPQVLLGHLDTAVDVFRGTFHLLQVAGHV